MPYMGIQPAYGRDYKSKKAVQEDWDAGNDFEITDMGPDCGRKINKADATALPDNVKIHARYNGQRSVMEVKR